MKMEKTENIIYTTVQSKYTHLWNGRCKSFSAWGNSSPVLIMQPHHQIVAFSGWGIPHFSQLMFRNKEILHTHHKLYQLLRLYFDLCLLTFPQEDQCLSSYAFRCPVWSSVIFSYTFHGKINPKGFFLHFSYNPVDSKMTVWNLNLLLLLQIFKNQN